MRITVLGGGQTGARFLADLLRVAGTDLRLSAVVPTTNDLYAYGLKVCPDIDAVLTACGTGPADDGDHVRTVLTSLGAEPTWLPWNDRTVAIDLVRTEMMQAGYDLTDVTTALTQRLDLGVDVFPMSNDRLEHHVVIEDEAGTRAIHIAEYVARHLESPARDQVFIGLDSAVASPAALEAIGSSDLIVLGPSSIALHLDPLLRLPSVYKAVVGSPGPVVGVAGSEPDHPHLREVTGAAAHAREHFADLVDVWASGTAAEVLSTAREAVRR